MILSRHIGVRTRWYLSRTLVMVATLAAVAGVGSAMTVATTSSPALTPVADTWTSATAPTANYGTQTVLRVDGSPAYVSYLRFDLSGVSTPITRATLQIYANSANSAGFSVHPVADTTWNERSMTFANEPPIGSATISSHAVSASSSVSFDVTSLLGGSGLVGFALTDNSSTAINLSSRESTHPPTLTLTTAVVAPAPTAAPTLVPTAAPTLAATPPATLAPTLPPTTAPTPTSTQLPATTPTQVPTASPAPIAPPSSLNPIRAAFYYPWFPEAWDQSGIDPFTHYNPSQGFYNGAAPNVVSQQISAMQYGGISVGIASWWGQGSSTDAKMSTLLSAAATTGFKWAIYYEVEGSSNPSSSQIASDLAYINDRYGSNANFYRIGGKPVIFVYAQPSDGCEMAGRWAAANSSHADYVVLKVFVGYTSCSPQPDQWHQYSPAVPADDQAGHSYAISPGFYKAGESTPRLARDLTRWKANVRTMVASGEPWQLVTTFNEWGEGTAVESATQWDTASGYGAYLDALHTNGAP